MYVYGGYTFVTEFNAYQYHHSVFKLVLLPTNSVIFSLFNPLDAVYHQMYGRPLPLVPSQAPTPPPDMDTLL